MMFLLYSSKYCVQDIQPVSIGYLPVKKPNVAAVVVGGNVELIVHR